MGKLWFILFLRIHSKSSGESLRILDPQLQIYWNSAGLTGRKKIKTYVLDTSAILTFFKKESGVNILDKLFENQENHFVISFLTPYEIYYTAFRDFSKRTADRFLRSTIQVGFEIDYENDINEIVSSGLIKGSFPLSAVDAWIASLAIRRNAIFVHKDPEFDALKDQINLLSLLYPQDPSDK